jgi:hypothetical protein
MMHFNTGQAVAMDDPSVGLLPGIQNAIISSYVWMA